MGKLFTPGQIRKLLNPQVQTVRWIPEDIASAISLRSVSPKAYRYLRNNGFPLPAFSTLRTWAATFNLNPGVLLNVLRLLKIKASELKEIDKLCVLSFDEIYVSNRIDIDKKNEEKIGPHKTCQTVMARGLLSNWKQPIYYQFDQQMTPEIIKNIILELYTTGFTVVAIVSDMGPGNMKFLSSLNVSFDKSCYFSHPADDSLNVYVFVDVPHLIKLLRNHVLDKGLTIGEHQIKRSCFEKIVNCSISDLTIAHKLTQYHLDVRGSQRQKVRPAVQLLSNSVSKAIKYLGQKGFMSPDDSWEKVSEVVGLFNDWFDLFNSRSKFGGCPEKNAFGIDLEKQYDILRNVSTLIEKIRVGKHKSLVPFQKGILLSNRSLSELYQYLHTKYKIEYILTARLNQDVLENFFSYIRGMGGPNDHPHPLDFKHRLKWYILGKYSNSIFTENQNVDNTEEACLLQPLSIKNDIPDREFCLTENIFKNFNIPVHSNEESIEEEFITCSFVEPSYPPKIEYDNSD